MHTGVKMGAPEYALLFETRYENYLHLILEYLSVR